MSKNKEVFKYFDFFHDKESVKRFLAYTIGPLICAAVLFYIYAKIVAPPPDEIFRGFMVTIVMTPLIAIPYVIYVLGLQYNLAKTYATLAKLVREDPLTKLLNRRGFYEEISIRGNNERYQLQNYHIQQSVETMKMKSGALLVLDIDNFKSINDTYGHDVGDAVLVELSKILTQSVRGDDIVARIGGEEFAIFLNGSSINDIVTIYERIRTTLGETPLYKDQQDIYVSVSCGVALAHDDAAFNSTYKNADQMLYKAKHTGKNRMYIHKNNLSLYTLDYKDYPSALFA